LSRELADPVYIGCDFGSTTAKAVVLSPTKELLYSAYVQSNGNPIQDAQALFRDIRGASVRQIAALALTGYGKDLLKGILGADLGVVETVAQPQIVERVLGRMLQKAKRASCPVLTTRFCFI
jgi:activator of 2-hydroxyglutaryl-CoA dehydratase